MDWMEFACLLGLVILTGILTTTHVAHYRLLKRIEKRDGARARREFKTRFRRGG